jgi:hypothetical protein
MHGRRVAQGPGVLRPHLFREGAGLLGPGVQRVIEQRLRVAAEEALGHAARRGEERPQPEAEREVFVGVAKRIPGRHYVEDSEPGHRPRGVECEPVRATGTPVVATDSKGVEAEGSHHLDLVAG